MTQQEYMDLRPLIRDAFTIDNLLDFSFLDVLIGSAKTHEEAKDYFIDLKKIISESFFDDNELLDLFYKPTEQKSIQMQCSEQCAKILKNIDDIPMPRKIANGLKQKTKYIENNNLNFIDFDDMHFKFFASTRAHLKRALSILKFKAINDSLYTPRFAGKNSTITQALRAGLNWVLTQSAYGHIYSAVTSLNRNRQINETSRSKTHVLNQLVQLPSGQSDKRDQIELAKRTASLKGITLGDSLLELLRMTDLKSEYSFSTIFNSVFDYEKNLRRLVTDNTIVEKYEYVNPVSGFTSYKSRRVKKDTSMLSDENIKTMVESFQNLNKYFENASAYIQKRKLAAAKENESMVKLVSGPEITALYSMTSYRGYEKAMSDSYFDSGGTLFGSCMRHPQLKRRINFYSQNDHFIKMLALVSKNGKVLHARAIVWYCAESNNHYVDRIFFKTEKDKLALSSYIEENEGFYSIYSGNNCKKTVDNFKILFPGCKHITLDPPYFDTMRSPVYKIGESYYIGRLNTADNSSVTTPFGGASFNATPILNKNSSNALTHEPCVLCGRYSSRPTKLDGNTICAKHLWAAPDRKTYGVVHGDYLFALKNAKSRIYYTRVFTSNKDALTGSTLFRTEDTQGLNPNLSVESKYLKMANLFLYGISAATSSGFGAKLTPYVENTKGADGVGVLSSFDLRAFKAQHYGQDIYDQKTVGVMEYEGVNYVLPINMTEDQTKHVLRELERYIKGRIISNYFGGNQNAISISNKVALEKAICVENFDARDSTPGIARKVSEDTIRKAKIMLLKAEKYSVVISSSSARTRGGKCTYRYYVSLLVRGSIDASIRIPIELIDLTKEAEAFLSAIKKFYKIEE